MLLTSLSNAVLAMISSAYSPSNLNAIEMTFGIGLVAALVALKRRSTTTRLKTLQLKLQKRSPPCRKLYQYPTKKLLSILFIVALGVCLEWVCLEHQKELREHLLLL